jgi:hypothetical protein
VSQSQPGFCDVAVFVDAARLASLNHTAPKVWSPLCSTAAAYVVGVSKRSVALDAKVDTLLVASATLEPKPAGFENYEAPSLRHRVVPSLPRLLDDVDMSFYSSLRGAEFGTTRQPAPASLENS